MSDPQRPTDEQGPGEDGPVPGFRESFADAIRKTGLGQVAPGEVPTASSLLKAVGGVRGLIESVLPGLGFIVLYTITRNLALSVLAPVALSVIFVVVRLVTRSAVTQALGGILVLAVSAVLALISGKPTHNFLPGIWINSAFLAVILITIIARWPLIGIVVGFLTNEPTEWRHDRAKRRVLYLVTWIWAALFVVRLAVELPLYFADQTVALGIARLITGVPLYAIVLWVSWLLVRAVYGRAKAAG